MNSLKGIVEKTGADAAAVMVPHATEPYLFCKDSYNCPAEWTPLKNPLDDSTANGRVYLSGKSEAGHHVDVELAEHLISSFIIVPITRDGKVIANLELIITNKNKTFLAEAQQVAEVFTKTLAEDL
jgi:hypothetical protein